MVADLRDQLHQSWNGEVFIYLEQALQMSEMVYPYTSRSARVACEAAIEKYYRENHKRGYEGQTEGYYPGGNFKGKEDMLKSSTKFMVR